MKLHIASDLHLEFGGPALQPTSADVVVLAGDVGCGMDGLKFARSALAGRDVIYVAGNHEYYGFAVPGLSHRLRRAARGTNVHLLENGSCEVRGIRFVGCTLWTDFSLYGSASFVPAIDEARNSMTDYRRIRHSPDFRPLCPRDTLMLHRRSVAYLRRILATPFAGPTVVVTHHAPSRRSLPDPAGAKLLWASYASNLDQELLALPCDLWVHGHTHTRSDYRVHRTRVICNPRGYPAHPVRAFEPDLLVEV